MKPINVWIALIWLANMAQAQSTYLPFVYPNHDNTFIIEQHADSLPEFLEDKVMLLEDGAGLWHIEEVYLQQRNKFVPIQGRSLLPLATHWLRVSLFNSTYQAGAWMLHLGQLDHAEVWQMHEQGEIEHLEVGLFKKIAVGEQWHDGAASIPIAIPARQTVTILAKINPVTTRKPRIVLELERQEVWLARWESAGLWVQIGAGLWLLVMAIALSAAFLRQQWHALWFATFFGMAQVWAIHQYGYLRFAFWDSSPVFNYHFGIVLLWAMPIFYWLFVRSLWQLKSLTPFVWVGIRGVLAIAGTLAGADVALAWLGLPAFSIDALLLFYCWKKSQQKSMPAFTWLIASFGFFFFAALGTWAWDEWFYTNLSHADLLFWQTGTIVMLAAFVVNLTEKSTT